MLIRAEQANDYSVCTTWRVRGKHAWLLDVCRVKLEFPGLQKRVLTEAQSWNAGPVLIEMAGSGIQLLQYFQGQGRPNIIGVMPRNDKATRLMSVTPAIESGRVAIPKEAPWMADFRREMLLFPNGKHDDQVDNVSQFLTWWDQSYQGPLKGSYGG